MGKVVTSGGLNEFISSGKVEQFKSDPKPPRAKEAPPLEVKDDKPIKDVKEPKEDKPAVKAEPEAPAEDTADDDDTRAATESNEKLRDAIARKNATINRKHREMREAREAAQEAEQFAKDQWNEKRLAEDKAAALERELTELRGKGAPAPEKKESGKPDPKAFTDEKGQFKAFEYAEALAAFAASEAVEKDRAKQAEERKQAEAAAAAAQAQARIAETVKKHPDYVQVVTDAAVTTHQMVLNYLAASEYIGDVSYYLAKTPDFVERINKMHPLKAIAEIGKLEATFEKPAVKAAAADEAAAVIAPKVSGASAPIKPLSGQAAVNTNTDPAKMTYKELRAYERSRQKR